MQHSDSSCSQNHYSCRKARRSWDYCRGRKGNNRKQSVRFGFPAPRRHSSDTVISIDQRLCFLGWQAWYGTFSLASPNSSSGANCTFFFHLLLLLLLLHINGVSSSPLRYRHHHITPFNHSNSESMFVSFASHEKGTRRYDSP